MRCMRECHGHGDVLRLGKHAMHGFWRCCARGRACTFVRLGVCTRVGMFAHAGLLAMLCAWACLHVREVGRVHARSLVALARG
jgi:hypothetical protein